MKTSPTPDKSGPEAGRGRSGRRKAGPSYGGRASAKGGSTRPNQTGGRPRPSSRPRFRPYAQQQRRSPDRRPLRRSPASPGRRGPGAPAFLPQAVAFLPFHDEAPHSQLALAAFLPVLYPLSREQRRHLPYVTPRARMEQRRRRVRGDRRAARNRGTRPRRAGRRRGRVRLRAGAAGRCHGRACALQPRGGAGLGASGACALQPGGRGQLGARVTASLWSAVCALHPCYGAGCPARRVCVGRTGRVCAFALLERAACALQSRPAVSCSPGYEMCARRNSENGKSLESMNG